MATFVEKYTVITIVTTMMLALAQRQEAASTSFSGAGTEGPRSCRAGPSDGALVPELRYRDATATTYAACYDSTPSSGVPS